MSDWRKLPRGPRNLPLPVSSFWKPSDEQRLTVAPPRYQGEDWRRLAITEREREWRRWLRGKMGRPGPRAITGRRRAYLAEAQDGCCADPFDLCPHRGQRLRVFQVDHRVPWHEKPDSGPRAPTSGCYARIAISSRPCGKRAPMQTFGRWCACRASPSLSCGWVLMASHCLASASQRRRSESQRYHVQPVLVEPCVLRAPALYTLSPPVGGVWWRVGVGIV